MLFSQLEHTTMCKTSVEQMIQFGTCQFFRYNIFHLFEAGNCVSNSRFEWMKNTHKYIYPKWLVLGRRRWWRTRADLAAGRRGVCTGSQRFLNLAYYIVLLFSSLITIQRKSHCYFYFSHFSMNVSYFILLLMNRVCVGCGGCLEVLGQLVRQLAALSSHDCWCTCSNIQGKDWSL